MKLTLTFLTLCLISYISASSYFTDLRFTNLTSYGRTFCRNLEFHLLTPEDIRDETFYGFKFEATSQSNTNSTNVRFIQLWSCNDLDRKTFDSPGTSPYECSDNMPPLEHCDLVYMWTPASTSAYFLPTNAYFVMGDGEDMNRFILTTSYEVSPWKDNSGVTVYFRDDKPDDFEEAGIMRLGVEQKDIRIPGLRAQYGIANNCENDCALTADWYIFSATPLIHHRGQSFQVDYFHKGLLRRLFYQNTNLQTSLTGTVGFIREDEENDYSSDRRVKVSKYDQFSTSCFYSTLDSSDTISGSDHYFSGENCMAFLAYYPKREGIRSCTADECKNMSGDANFFGNIVANYVALSLAGILIGIILGIFLLSVVQRIQEWFEKNSGRFALRHIASGRFFNPFWWFKEDFDPLDDEEEKPAAPGVGEDAKVKEETQALITTDAT